MNKQFGMIENIIMPNTNTQRKGIGQSTSQRKRLEEIIDIIRITYKGRRRWLRKIYNFFHKSSSKMNNW
jgi:hypothetical protein